MKEPTFFARPQLKKEEKKSFFPWVGSGAKRGNTVLRPPFTYGPRKMIECTSSPPPTSGKRDYHVQLSQVFSLPERVEIRDGLEMPSILSRRTSPPTPPPLPLLPAEVGGRRGYEISILYFLLGKPVSPTLSPSSWSVGRHRRRTGKKKGHFPFLISSPQGFNGHCLRRGRLMDFLLLLCPTVFTASRSGRNWGVSCGPRV